MKRETKKQAGRQWLLGISIDRNIQYTKSPVVQRMGRNLRRTASFHVSVSFCEEGQRVWVSAGACVEIRVKDVVILMRGLRLQWCCGLAIVQYSNFSIDVTQTSATHRYSPLTIAVLLHYDRAEVRCMCEKNMLNIVSILSHSLWK